MLVDNILQFSKLTTILLLHPVNATPYYVIFPNYYSLLTSEFAMAKRSNNGAIKQRAYNKDYLMLGFIPSETLPIKPICFL